MEIDHYPQFNCFVVLQKVTQKNRKNEKSENKKKKQLLTRFVKLFQSSNSLQTLSFNSLLLINFQNVH